MNVNWCNLFNDVDNMPLVYCCHFQSLSKSYARAARQPNNINTSLRISFITLSILMKICSCIRFKSKITRPRTESGVSLPYNFFNPLTFSLPAQLAIKIYCGVPWKFTKLNQILRFSFVPWNFKEFNELTLTFLQNCLATVLEMVPGKSTHNRNSTMSLKLSDNLSGGIGFVVKGKTCKCFTIF